MKRSSETLAALCQLTAEQVEGMAEMIDNFRGEGPDEWDEQLLERHAISVTDLRMAASGLNVLGRLFERPPTKETTDDQVLAEVPEGADPSDGRDNDDRGPQES